MTVDLTAMHVEVTVTVDAPIEVVFARLTDVERMPETSDELQAVEWVVGDSAAVGNVFQGHNRREGFEWSIPCHIIALDAPRNFAWTVMDPAEPSSTWSYELDDQNGRTVVTQRFLHGPNLSGLTFAVERHPDRRDDIVAGRAAELRSAMERGLAAVRAELER